MVHVYRVKNYRAAAKCVLLDLLISQLAHLVFQGHEIGTYTLYTTDPRSR